MAAIFFDLDDTLFDYQSAKNAAVAEYMRFSERAFSGAAEAVALWDDIAQHYMEAYHCGHLTYAEQQQQRVAAFLNKSINAEQAHQWNSHYQTIYEQFWAVFDDVLPVLQALYGRYPLAIITDGPPQQERKLQKLNIASFFEHMTIPQEVGMPKPAAAIFELAAKKMQCLPRNCWYVGNDYQKDYEGAKAAGFNAVWLNRAGVCNPAKKYCTNLQQFLSFLESADDE